MSFEAAINEMSGTLIAAQAEYDRLRAASETTEQRLQTLADTIAAAAENLRAALPQPETSAEPVE